MNPWIEQHIVMLRDIEEPMTAEQRLNVARLFEQCETMLTERTNALHRIGHAVGAGPGCDLVRELPVIVRELVNVKGKA